MAKPQKKQIGGTWAKAVGVSAGGAVSTTIPAGIFQALPVIKHTVQATGSRDYVFRIATLTLNADKSVTLTGVVRESRQLLALGDSFGALTTAVTLHLSAEESD